MPLAVRTFDENYELARSLLRNYINGADVSEGSDFDITARILAALFTGNQGQAEYLSNQIFASDAEGDFLLRHATKVGGPLPAAAASGQVQLTAPSGTDTVTLGSTLTHVDGTEFATAAVATIALPGWSAKTVVEGTNRYRLFVSPDTSGMAVGDLLEVGGSVRAIEGIDTNTGAVDLYEPLLADPAAGTAVNPVRGAVVAVTASATGPAGNKPQGDVLELSSPPGVVDAEVRVVELTGGALEEGDDDLRARVVAYEEQPPGNGNAAEYRDTARRLQGVRVADALVYPGFRGFGTVDVIPVGPAGARFPTQTMVDAVAAEYQQGLDTGSPYVDDVLVTAGSLGSYTEVEISVQYETGFEPDYRANGLSVQTSGSSATRLDVGTDPTTNSTIKVGSRVLYAARFGGIWQVYERTVTAIGATYIDLNEALPLTPTTNPDGRDDLFPSGPLGLSVVAALEGVFDDLGWGIGGPGIGSGFRFQRFPRVSDSLDPVLRMNALRCAIKGMEGVRDVTLVSINDTTPADITPAAQTRLRQGQLTITFTEF